ncbi:response regulator transcription factor [Martelella radicis]|uniref:DNA-binding NarL/FixJ family response regulator n=1 Tax=Martelella radicis TaxID=1397476 RepID=A0A7W6KQM3_9HYPH|nr:response regulator transcription factor [Martelella radicis]MBB4124339.1 DNA-binding NarL/FixJ family response regulator [Martelella radicis]
MAENAAQEIVLLVDDSPEALSFLTEALEASGYSVLIATSGESAINIVARITPDIVLMDAVMPKMDGFEACRRLKAGPAAESPVIFMTGLSETEHIVHALESGGVDYLTKPINIDELRARIRVHLANARSAQSARVALDATGRHLLAAGPDGMPRWMTPQAGRLIGEAAGGSPDMKIVGSQIAAWLAEGNAETTPGSQPMLPVNANGKTLFQLAFLEKTGADEFLFRVTAANPVSDDEALRKHFPLTMRESEVLLWIAKGKTNRDIADILGLSTRTVNKHLETIYVKLGVENRASAAVKAAYVLHDM